MAKLLRKRLCRYDSRWRIVDPARVEIHTHTLCKGPIVEERVSWSMAIVCVVAFGSAVKADAARVGIRQIAK